jgi:DNA-binding LacI/PurR family transcriptional regulator/DNA-binding transcriptional regulator YhcF (GntR family)
MKPIDTIQRNVQDSMQTQVENFILGKIESDEWPVASKIPSERDLSIKLEVSRTTVRNAIQALTTRGMFDRRIGQGTFVRQRLGTPPLLSSRSTKGTFGYVICKERSLRKPISSEAFYFDVFAGIEEETVRSGRHMLFSYLDDRSADEVAAFRSFLDKVDGVVIEEARDSAFLDMIEHSGVPAALLAPTAIHERLDCVTMDIGSGVRKAVRYLRGLGHERIGIVNGPLGIESARVRFAAWEDEMGAGDKSPGAGEVLVCGGEGWSAEAGFAAMDGLLDRRRDFTALFCANDLLAVGTLSALAKHGLRVPEDVSVVGFDDTELARHSSPPLTTMRIYSRDMARSAVKRVLERIEGGAMPPVKLEYPIDLIVRESCKEVKR